METKKNQKNSLFLKITFFISLCVFLFSGFEFFKIFKEYYHNQKVLEEAQDLFDIRDYENNNGKEYQNAFIELQKINQDIVGWITINDTKIDYPVLHTTDNQFYLTHNYKKEYSRAGSIFMDYRNDILENEKNLIIYGHRMKDGTMFNSLKKFLEKDFFDSHSAIYFNTLFEQYDAQVFAVYQTTTDFNYIQTDFESDDDFQKFIDTIKEKSIYKTDVEVTKNDVILTLSTCDYSLDKIKGRIAVHAKLIKHH